MFEKSLYDLIRGLRNHKGSEKEYIQRSLKECRAEIRGQDMDLKATALLKLIYLEMFGHDMSWAAFHVLEVMSSPKYLQKRVGYLGAVQSFRPDTEVLMLATNLLKKDVTSTAINSLSLPIITLPHIINPSLAMSVVSDLLPRLIHSSPVVRKKTIVTLYRLALVYPETLRAAWPKIKERLMDEEEDSTVTAAIVNVVCELGWRRPQDFLPLAPRLFELLVDSGNNWMAIKLIKLFATLTPLEPRLVKKLLPPLTSIIRTTPAMSLLYECINGIIQGGILNSSDNDAGGEEIASLCVGKLRSMMMVEGDPNLKYVALLAFNKIVLSHPFLVAQQEDVIMECIDSPDISLRLRALDLVAGMVSTENVMAIVGRLMRQLRNSPSVSADNFHHSATPIEPAADSDNEAPELAIRADKGVALETLLPDDYKDDVINRILQMCSSNTYKNLADFDWYIDILIQLIRNAPFPTSNFSMDSDFGAKSIFESVSVKIGEELRAVAVKVRAVRPQATRAAESILLSLSDGIASNLTAGSGALRPVAWIAGEYAMFLSSPEDTVTALLKITKPTTSAESIIVFLQAIPKILVLIISDERASWTPTRKSLVTLLMARIIYAFEPLAMHPDLEVQERSAEYLDLLKLAAEASSGQEALPEAGGQDAPLLLTQVMPSLFRGMELNSVALGAQKNVPLPSGLDLDQPINPNLYNLLQAADITSLDDFDGEQFEIYYHRAPPEAPSINEPAIKRLVPGTEEPVQSYQGLEESYLDPDIVARRRAERLERNKDDPFYIASAEDASGPSTPLHNIFKNNNGPDLDIDDIPIMQLDLGKTATSNNVSPPRRKPFKQPRQRIQIAADETLGASGASTPRIDESENRAEAKPQSVAANKGKQPLLQVDSSHLRAFSLEGEDGANGGIDFERQQKDEAEMAKAMREVERLRLEMQRANERIKANDEAPTLVKKKLKKKKPAGDEAEAHGGNEIAVVKRKKKKAKRSENTQGEDADHSMGTVETDLVKSKKKKKKKKSEVESAHQSSRGIETEEVL